MKPIVKKIKDNYRNLFMPITAFLAAFLLCGAILGNAAAFKASVDTDSALYRIFSEGEGPSAENIPTPGLLSSFAGIGKFHLAVWLLGFSCVGIFLIPFVVAAKGFFLTFSIACMYKLSGAHGLLAAIAAFGLQNMIALPCLLLISSQAFSVSASLFSYAAGWKREGGDVFTARYFLLSLMVLLALFFAAILEAALTPVLLRMIL